MTVIRPIHTFMLVTLLLHMPFVGTRMAAALYAIELGASPATVGMLTALLGLMPMLLSLRIGRWCDRVGIRRPMLAGGVVYLVGIVAGFGFGSLTGLVIMSACTGLGYSLYFVAQQHQSGRIGRPEELATNLSMSLMSFSISAFVAPLLTGFAIDGFGTRTALLTLIAYVVPGMLIVTANRTLFPDGPVHAKAPDAAPSGPGASRLDGIRSLLRVPDLKRVYVAAAISQMVWDTINLLMPLYGKAHGFSASEIGLVLGVFSLFTLVIRLLLPALSRRFKPWQLLILSLGGSSLSYFAIPLLDSMPPLIVVAAWLGIAIGVAAPMLLLLIHHVSPQDRLGEAVGFRVMINGSSQTIMPLVTGSLAAIFGLTSMFWVVGLLLASGAAINRDRWRQAPQVRDRASS